MTKRSGSGLLAVALVLCFITSITALASAQLANSMFNTVQINKIKLEADSYAATKASILRDVPYDKLKSSDKTIIDNTDFYDQVTLGEEQTAADSPMKQRNVVIKVFYGDEEEPRSTLDLTRATWNSTGCPIGSIIAWPSSSLPNDGGIWLRCDGSSIPAKYTSLIALIGHNTPNFKGKFLRGYGSADGSHSSGALLSIQKDAVQWLHGSFYTYLPQLIGNNPYAANSWKTDYTHFTGEFCDTTGIFSEEVPAWQETAFDRQDGNYYENYTYCFKIKFSNECLGTHLANESRPINTAVYFLIKAE
jgi:hypothetical protein